MQNNASYGDVIVNSRCTSTTNRSNGAWCIFICLFVYLFTCL